MGGKGGELFRVQVNSGTAESGVSSFLKLALTEVS